MIPQKLKKEPLIEAIWELRFSSSTNHASQLLGGLLFQRFKEYYPTVQTMQALPQDNAQVFGLNQNLRFEGLPYMLQVTEKALSLVCVAPYTGWSAFSERILELVEFLKSTGLITSPERFSLKYTDLISGRLVQNVSLDLLNFNLDIGGQSFNESPVEIKTEITEGDYKILVQVAYPAEVEYHGATDTGLIVAVDTIFPYNKPDFWDVFPEKLNECHAVNKRRFFEILKESTVKDLEPDYAT